MIKVNLHRLLALLLVLVSTQVAGLVRLPRPADFPQDRLHQIVKIPPTQAGIVPAAQPTVIPRITQIAAINSQYNPLPRLPKVLSLRDAVMLALRTNPDIQNAELDRIVQRFAVLVAHNAYEPQYDFNAGATITPGSAPMYSASPEMSLLTPWGAEISAELNNNINGSQIGNTTTFKITEPLWRGFGRQVTLAPLYQAYDTNETEKLAMKSTVIKTVTTVISNYYTLIQAHDELNIAQLALKSSLAQLRQDQLEIKAGRIPRTELVQQQAQVADQRLAISTAENTITQAYQAFLVTLGLDPHIKLKIAPQINTGGVHIPRLSQSIGIALDDNPDYQTDIINQQIAEQQLIIDKDQRRWQVNLIAQAPVTVGAAPATEDHSIGVAVKIPIDDMAAKEAVIKDEVAIKNNDIQLAQAKRSLTSDVMTEIDNLKTEKREIALAEQSVKLARDSLRIARIKQDHGLTTAFETTTLQTELTNAENNLIQQKIALMTTWAGFQALLGTTLQYWQIQINY